MSIRKKLAFLGAGNMAGALIRGVLESGAADAAHVWAADPRAERLAELARAHAIRTGSDNAEAARWADVIVLAVKPQVFAELFEDIAGVVTREQLVVSIAAGVTLNAIERALGDDVRVIRAMPNTPALVHAGATAFAPGRHATADDLAVAATIFSGVGMAIELEERHLDAVTGLSGSGPAYVFRLVEALIAGGEAAGLDPEDARRLATQTVRGAAELLVTSGESPSALRDKVTSPKGTTEAGLCHLAEAGFFDAVVGAVQAATKRSRDLGEETEEALGRQ
jgi:pyrroline-5-carboxylate reductase